MSIILNNCHGRDHAELYGEGAFFDLSREQLRHLPALTPGALCTVVEYAGTETLLLKRFTFTRAWETEAPDDPGLHVRVLYGTPFAVETIPKSEAFASVGYRNCFDSKGSLIQRSVLKG